MSDKVIDANKVLCQFNGKPLELEVNAKTGEVLTYLTVGKAIAYILSGSRQKILDSFKSYKLSQKFFEGGLITLDSPDFESLRKCITEHGREVYLDLILGQLMEVLINSDDLSKKEVKPNEIPS